MAQRCAAVLALAVACAALVSATAAATSSATLPNPCTILTKVHPELAFAHKGTRLGVTHRKLTHYGAGKQATSTCSETVGTRPVYLSVSLTPSGGFGGVNVTSTTHPVGLGSGDVLIVGKSPSGSPVDFLEFHTATVYANLSANGEAPSSLTTLARQIYKLLR